MAQVAAFGVLAFFFVEALFGLVAQPFSLDHRADEGRHSHFRALVADLCGLCGEVLRYVGHDVDADHVAEAEGAGLGPAERRAGEGVDLFDGEVSAPA